MGLDTYSSKQDLDVYKDITGLCGGILSGNGQGSFRGKVYDNFILRVTEESLYQERIPNVTVRKMARKLTDYVKNNTKKSHDEQQLEAEDSWDVTWKEAKILAEWFRITAGYDADVEGWW